MERAKVVLLGVIAALLALVAWQLRGVSRLAEGIDVEVSNLR
jgi:hypothetical protein